MRIHINNASQLESALRMHEAVSDMRGFAYSQAFNIDNSRRVSFTNTLVIPNTPALLKSSTLRQDVNTLEGTSIECVSEPESGVATHRHYTPC